MSRMLLPALLAILLLQSSGQGGLSGPASGGSFGSGGSSSGSKALSNIYPNGDGALHWGIQTNNDMKPPQGGHAIIPAEHG